ncbi:MAG: SDR family oxidoreductase [Candidatus Paceibacterota bacterium]|jgi:3-oxoacyl-[acyl-carrier protein] reductase
MSELKNKIAVVLGGTGSLGGAIAEALEKEGMVVIKHGRKAGEYSADLAKDGELLRLLGHVVSKFGRIDILVNSVSAPLTLSAFDKKTWDDFLNHLNIQLKSAVIASQFVLPEMAKRKFGKIVNIITSAVEGVPPSHMADYVTAKYALLGLTKALAKEHGRFGVTVSAVSPSLVKNDFTKTMPAKMIEILEAQSPSSRLVTPSDVAEAVLAQVKNFSQDVNGENIVVLP